GEVETVLAGPDVTTPNGLRDRVILETLYSTGLRRRELIRLGLGDTDPERGVVFVRQGKGHKDRFCPIGERALAWVKKYLTDDPPCLGRPTGPGGGALFLTERGRPLSAKYMSWLVTGYVAAADLGKTGSCNLFRHTLAT